MSKLFGQILARAGKRGAGTGDDNKLTFILTYKNRHEYTIEYTAKGLKVEGDGGVLLDCDSEHMDEVPKGIKCLWCDKPATHKDYREIDGMTTSTRECDDCANLDTDFLLERDANKKGKQHSAN